MPLAFQLLFALAFFSVWLWVGRQLALRIPQTQRLQPVSWDGGVVLALAVFQLFVLPTLTAEILVAAGKLERGQDLQITTSLLVGNGISYAIAVTVGMWVLRSMAGATKRQLGVDRLYLKLPRDAGWGLVAWLFALPPTYVLQVPLVQIESKRHPVIDALQGETGSVLWLTAWITVVIGAPLAEEFLFRLTLQGWFYRFVGTWYEAERRAHELREGEDHRPVAPPFWVAAMPVLATAVAFSAVHARHGMAPIALFPLALTLGVLYHRTRRLMPCVVCHAAFNAMNLALLPLD